ncbi:Conserved_hypothetical protein [Hexamita inflata]|uniref:Uncharacterized protein n=1 Tax=Hexamita inflata TaxID=28002 RepID=A0AA86NB84_9EUKA|nr:Conserved hypothetical protein [Hexamita inflata]
MAQEITETTGSSDYMNPQGYKFSDNLKVSVDQFTGIGQPIANFEFNIPVEPPAQLPQFGQFDYSKRYQASAILTEHDIAARAKATTEMETNPIYACYKYGESAYFVEWEILVRANIQELIRTKGAPQCLFDGSTGLPINSIYSNQIYSQNRLERRRHSLVDITEPLIEPEFLKEQKSQLRRQSIAYKTEHRLPPLHRMQKIDILKFKDQYKMEVEKEEENDDDEGSE